MGGSIMTHTLQMPVLLFGGPYSNLEASSAMRAEAARLGIAPKNCICTGDVVAYCADPCRTVDLVRDWSCHVVMGNCEQALGSGADDCGCGFEPGSVCNLAAIEWFSFARARLDQEQLDWMAALPRAIDANLNGCHMYVIHGGTRLINKYIFASDSEDVFHEEFSHVSADLIVAGHAGLPFVRSIGSRLWINAGAIGMPANDASHKVWYSLLTAADEGGLEISFHQLTYDHASAAQKIRDAGLPPGYADALETGLWPGLDVLPKAEKEQTGRPLRCNENVWRPPVHPGDDKLQHL